MPTLFEVIEHEGVRFAEVIWAGARAEQSSFFSPPESSFQFGLLARPAGFVEAAHYHKPLQRRWALMRPRLEFTRRLQRALILTGFVAFTSP